MDSILYLIVIWLGIYLNIGFVLTLTHDLYLLSIDENPKGCLEFMKYMIFWPLYY